MDMLDAANLRRALVFPGRQRPLVFVLGSGLTMPTADCLGVLGAAEIVERLKEMVKVNYEESLYSKFAETISGEANNRYQAAFSFLKRNIVDDDLQDRVVREAVVAAFAGHITDTERRELLSGSTVRCEDFDHKFNEWHLRPGVEALGQIIVKAPHFFGTTITTNFDPLIEIAIRKAFGNPVTTVIDDDGALGSTHTRAPQVVHIHGYWWGSSLLHTADKVAGKRLKLKGSLTALLASCDVCVLAYGGWDDVFRNALSDHLNSANRGKVHWCFREDEETVRSKYSDLLARFEEFGRDEGINLYSSIDVDIVLPALLEKVELLSRDRGEAQNFNEAIRQNRERAAEIAQLNIELHELRREKRWRSEIEFFRDTLSRLEEMIQNQVSSAEERGYKRIDALIGEIGSIRESVASLNSAIVDGDESLSKRLNSTIEILDGNGGGNSVQSRLTEATKLIDGMPGLMIERIEKKMRWVFRKN